MFRHLHRRISNDPWWHVAGLMAGLLFALMLMIARLYPYYFDGIDTFFEMYTTRYQSLKDIEWFLVVTALGSVTGIITVAAGVILLLRRTAFGKAQLVLLLLFTSVSMAEAKVFVERVRPSALTWLDPLNTYSFPSGHAALTTALYGFLAVSIWQRMKKGISRTILASLCILIIGLVGLSRMVLNYHYFSDVIAGVLLGFFWLVVVLMIPTPRLK